MNKEFGNDEMGNVWRDKKYKSQNNNKKFGPWPKCERGIWKRWDGKCMKEQDKGSQNSNKKFGPWPKDELGIWKRWDGKYMKEQDIGSQENNKKFGPWPKDERGIWKRWDGRDLKTQIKSCWWKGLKTLSFLLRRKDRQKWAYHQSSKG